MRAVLQRVNRASVSVEGETVGAIAAGFLVLVGVGKGDTEEDANQLADKILNLRVFTDAEGKFNLSLLDVKGELLVVSQFTLFGDCRKGRRPGFSDAAPPEEGRRLYERLVEILKLSGVKVACGRFQSHMVVSLENDGPVTMLLDSRKLF